VRTLSYIAFFLFLSNGLSGQSSVQYSKKSYQIEAAPSSNSFTQTIQYKGIYPANHQEAINIYYGELDEIKGLTVRYRNARGKWKTVSKKNIISSAVNTQSFYDGVRKLSFTLDKQDRAFPFEVNYQMLTKDLMFLATISFRDKRMVDTFDYNIVVPKGHVLQYKTDEPSEAQIAIKETEESQHKLYRFFSDRAMRTLDMDAETIRVRMMVHPKEVLPFDHFNDWYRELVQPHSRINSNTITAMESAIEGISNDNEKIKTIFQLVQNKISYISFESGIGAVQPRDVNQIFEYKQGDCKDMGNLLCQSLKHFGYEAYMAISSTVSHRYDLDFPCLASANHAICVIKINDEWKYLDATESHGIYGYPSRQIQDRNIFIINDTEGLLHKVEKVAAENNRANYDFHFVQNKNSLDGDFNFQLNGLSQIDFVYIQNYSTADKANNVLTRYLESWAKNIEVEAVDIATDLLTTALSGAVKTSKNFTALKQKTYLSLNFLPKPELSEQQLKEEDQIVTYQAVNNHYNIVIDLEEDVRLQEFTPVTFEENGMKFQFKVSQENPTQLNVNYHYYNEHILIKDSLIESYNKINHLIEETLQKSIIYDTKT